RMGGLGLRPGIRGEKLPKALRRPPARQVRKPGGMKLVHALAEEALRERPACDRRMLQVGVEPLEEQRAPCRLGRARPEAPDLGLAEQVVPREYLVRPLPGQHDLVALRAHAL